VWCEMADTEGINELLKKNFLINDDILRLGLIMQAKQSRQQGTMACKPTPMSAYTEPGRGPSAISRAFKKLDRGDSDLPRLPKAKAPSFYPTRPDWKDAGITTRIWFQNVSPALAEVYQQVFNDPKFDIEAYLSRNPLSDIESNLDAT
jgi:hypothetical protein